MNALVFDRVSFAWPDGSVALDEVSGSFGDGRTGLVGANGSGKTTLLRLAVGELRPTSGHLERPEPDDVAYVPQRVAREPATRVAALLGVAEPLDAVRAIASGDVDPTRFDAVGDDWDVEARAGAALDAAGLDPGVLDRTVGELSGGEAVVAALVGVRLRGARVTLLDEPTNSLDRDARRIVHDLVRTWRGALVVVSHDVDLLDLVDETTGLRDHRLTTFGGGYRAWRERLAVEQAAAQQAAVDARKTLAHEKRQRIEAETVIARRARYARTDYENKRRPRVIMKLRAGEAEVSAGKLRTAVRDQERAARRALDEAQRRVRTDESIRIDLPDPGVAAGRRIAELGDGERAWVVQGPERIALTGPNGAGKTTLLRALLAGTGETVETGTHSAGGAAERDDPLARVRANSALDVDRVAFLPQGVDGLDDGASALDVMRAAAAETPDGDLTNRLARFLLRGDAVHRRVSALSGGERFRLALARLLLADPPPQLLVLDEPTNDLDLDTVEQLLSALTSYRGAVLIVSHDEAFLRRLEPDLVLELRDDALTERALDEPG